MCALLCTQTGNVLCFSPVKFHRFTEDGVPFLFIIFVYSSSDPVHVLCISCCWKMLTTVVHEIKLGPIGLCMTFKILQ